MNVEKPEFASYRSISSIWQTFWFRPASAFNLAFPRILFFAGMLLSLPFREFYLWHDVPHLYWQPLELYELLRLQPWQSQLGLWLLQWLFGITLLMATIGLFTRLSMLLAFLLGFYLIGLPNNYGHAFHYDTVPLVVMGILAFSRAGDTLSLDQKLFRKQRPKLNLSAEYGWPLRLIVAYMCLCFFSAGVCKLQTSGLQWALSDNLHWITLQQRYSGIDIFWDVAPEVTRSAIACALLGLGTLVLELGAPLAIVNSKLKLAFGFGLIAMQLFIFVCLGPNFCGWILCFSFWVPWEQVLSRIKILPKPEFASPPKMA